MARTVGGGLTTAAQRLGASREQQAMVAQIAQGLVAGYETIPTDQLSARLLEDPSLFHLGNGMPVIVDETRRYETLVESQTGTASVRVVGEVTASEWNTVTGQAVIDWSQSLDPNSLTAETLRALPELAPLLHGSPGATPTSVQQAERARIMIDLDSGLTRRIDYQKAIAVGGLRQVEHKRITVSRPGTPR